VFTEADPTWLTSSEGEDSKKGKSTMEKSAKLNERFADWFYVISGEAFRGLQIDLALLRGAPAGTKKPEGE